LSCEGVLLGRSVQSIDPKTMVFASLPIIQSKNLGHDIQRCKDHGFWVYGLDASAKQDAFTTQWPDKVLLIAGNETKGMRAGIQKQCDEMVRINLDEKLDSLNVAVATSIVLFQVRHYLGLDGL